jgi:serine/threonine protein kinase
MELLAGIDFEKHLEDLEARGERLSLERLSAIIEPVVETLERAHDAEILHRDLKPANIFLLSDGEGVRLFDFGLSRKRNSARLTVIGTIMGSPSYIAPEVWKGRSDDLDTRVDVYSLGVILFRALSGRLPFEGSSLRDSFLQTTTAPRPSLHALRPDLPSKVDDWVKKALAIDRAHRFETVTALWNGLLGALRYVPPPRPIRPVADSLVNAWRAATTAFRRFIPGAGSTPPPPMPERTVKPPSIPSMPVDTSAIDDDWTEITDDEIESSLPAPADDLTKTDEAWDEVTDAELDRRSLYGTTSVVDEWVSSTEAAPGSALPPPAAAPATSQARRKAGPDKKTRKAAKKPSKKMPKKPAVQKAAKPKASGTGKRSRGSGR